MEFDAECWKTRFLHFHRGNGTFAAALCCSIARCWFCLGSPAAARLQPGGWRCREGRGAPALHVPAAAVPLPHCPGCAIPLHKQPGTSAAPGASGKAGSFPDFSPGVEWAGGWHRVGSDFLAVGTLPELLAELARAVPTGKVTQRSLTCAEPGQVLAGFWMDITPWISSARLPERQGGAGAGSGREGSVQQCPCVAQVTLFGGLGGSAVLPDTTRCLPAFAQLGEAREHPLLPRAVPSAGHSSGFWVILDVAPL